MPVDIAEMLLVSPMTDLYNSLRKIFRDNDILMADEIYEEQRRIAMMEIVKQSKANEIKDL